MRVNGIRNDIQGRYPFPSSFLGRPRGRYCNARPVSFSSLWMNFSEPQGKPFSAWRRKTSSLEGSSPWASQADQLPMASNCLRQLDFVVSTSSCLRGLTGNLKLGCGRQSTPQSALDLLRYLHDKKITRRVQIILARLINDTNMVCLFRLGVRNDRINFTNNHIFAILVFEAYGVSNWMWFFHGLSPGTV